MHNRNRIVGLIEVVRIELDAVADALQSSVFKFLWPQKNSSVN